jgi:hypothetical protein
MKVGKLIMLSKSSVLLVLIFGLFLVSVAAADSNRTIEDKVGYAEAVVIGTLIELDGEMTVQFNNVSDIRTKELIVKVGLIEIERVLKNDRRPYRKGWVFPISPGSKLRFAFPHTSEYGVLIERQHGIKPLNNYHTLENTRGIWFITTGSVLGAFVGPSGEDCYLPIDSLSAVEKVIGIE